MTTNELRELLPYLSEAERAELDGLLTTAPPTFREYVDRVTRGRYDWHRPHEVLADRLQDVADGRIKRLMVFMPPRLGKSEQVSRLLPGYYLRRRPEHHVGVCSYAATKAYEFSRAAKGYFVEHGGRLDRDAVEQWETPEGGSAWFAGVGGPLTGFGGHGLIIDDPVKNEKEAQSELIRRNHQEWWETTFRTRLEPGGWIVLVMTRWHEDDLAGWLLERERHNADARERWHILAMPAEAEEPQEWPASCTVEPDWREPGEPLCPARLPPDEMRIHKASARTWASLYQQRPRPREGAFFKYDWFTFVDAAPANAKRVRYWDTAGTDGAGDYTVGCLMSKGENGLFYIEDVVRGQWSPGHRDNQILATAQKDGRGVRQWLEEEAGVAGKERTRHTTRMLAGFTVSSERPTGDKETRADPLASQAEVGNVRIVKGAWNTAFLDELCAFPLGAHDDQVDAASGAFSKLSLRAEATTAPFKIF